MGFEKGDITKEFGSIVEGQKVTLSHDGGVHSQYFNNVVSPDLTNDVTQELAQNALKMPGIDN